MADRIVGYPTNLTTVTDNGAGFCRVTFAPWELDWEFFLGLAVDGTHYLANTTSAVSSAISAKGGAENTGYWIDIAQGFPSANWVSGNRITPQRQAAINQYATIALASAAVNNNDAMLMWYRTTTNARSWLGQFNMNAKAWDVWGMLSGQGIQLTNGAQIIIMQGDHSGVPLPVVFKNFSYTGSSYCVNLSFTAGKYGPGETFDRLRGISDGGQGLIYGNSLNPAVLTITNCIFMMATKAVYLGVNGAAKIYNCTATLCTQGFSVLNATLGKNLAAIECGTCFSAGPAFRNCVDSDGSLPVDATNLRNQDARTQLRFFFDHASPGQKKFPIDYRPHQDSVLLGAGVAGAGIPLTDADGRTRPNPPSIGPWEPYGTCYAPASEIIRGKRGAVA